MTPALKSPIQRRVFELFSLLVWAWAWVLSVCSVVGSAAVRFLSLRAALVWAGIWAGIYFERVKIRLAKITFTQN